MKRGQLAYQREKEELLGKKQKEKLKNQSIKSIKSWADSSGTTSIIIETDNYFIFLGATDLGAWLERIRKRIDYE